MSRGLGKVERYILGEIERAKNPRDARFGPTPVRIRTWDVLYVFRPLEANTGSCWSAQDAPAAQRKAVVRAMHSFVRKFPQFALMGGQGRKQLVLYEAGDPLSEMWARLTVERREFVPIMEARAALRELDSMSDRS
jgi:hypothetical protein